MKTQRRNWLVLLVVSGCFLASAAHADLVGHWALDGNALDSSGNGNHGNAVGNPIWLTTGQKEGTGAVDLNGTDQYIELADMGEYDQVTIAFWMNGDTNEFSGDFLGLVSSAAWEEGVFHVSVRNGKIEVYLHEGGSNRGRLTSPVVENNRWYHVAMTADNDGKMIRLFLDGEPVATDTINITTGFKMIQQFIGFEGDPTQHLERFFDGRFDDVRIYNHVLSLTEIQSLLGMNFAPNVDAGPKQHVWLPDASNPVDVQLQGEVSDDGLPSGNLSYSWSVVEDPNETVIVFDPPSADVMNPVVTLDKAGKYVFQLTASDGVLETSDTVEVEVHPTEYTGLIAHWKLDETSGTAVSDSSGNGYDGVLVFDPNTGEEGWDAGLINGALSFDGKVSHVAVGDLGNYSQMTVAFWMNAGNINSAKWQGLVSSSAWEEGVFHIAAASGKVEVFLHEGGGLRGRLTSPVLNNNQWYHVAITADTSSDELYLYLNGEKVSSDNIVDLVTDIKLIQQLFGMEGSVSDNRFFEGQLDDILVYEIGLPGAKIWDDMIQNLPPVVTITSDSYGVVMPEIVNLTGVVSDDGLPIDTVTLAWSKESGPGTVDFSDPTSANTSAAFSAAGSHVLRLTADDGEKATFGEIMIKVYPEGAERGLIAHWKMDDGSGNIVSDSTVNGFAGTLVGETSPPTWAEGQIGGALQFLGAEGYVNCEQENPDDLVIDTGMMTVMAWIKVDEFNVRWQSIITRGDNSWRLERYASSATEIAWQVKPYFMLTTGPDFNMADGKWHHLAGTYDGEVAHLYVDGREVNSKVAPGMIPPASEYAVWIGNNAQYPYRFWNGLIDSVRLYELALSTVEIKLVYLDEGGSYTCLDVREQGLTLLFDVSGPEGVADCYVDLYDFLSFASSWLQCNDPENDNCLNPFIN